MDEVYFFFFTLLLFAVDVGMDVCCSIYLSLGKPFVVGESLVEGAVGPFSCLANVYGFPSARCCLGENVVAWLFVPNDSFNWKDLISVRVA